MLSVLLDFKLGTVCLGLRLTITKRIQGLGILIKNLRDIGDSYQYLFFIWKNQNKVVSLFWLRYKQKTRLHAT